MCRPVLFLGLSLLAAMSLQGSPLLAQDLSPSKPPAGNETPGAAAPQQPDAPPRRPNAQGGGNAAGGGTGRRNLDPANLPIPDDIQVVRDVIYATAPDKDGRPVELKMDCAFLKQSDGKPMPVVMYIHGGGWSGGDRAMGLPLSIPFARGGYFTCTVSYRLSGQAIYPAQIFDVKAAVRFLRANAQKLAIDPEHIGVWGHSAGGHLSALLGVTGEGKTMEGDEGNANASSRVQAVVDISGPTDLVRIAPGGNGGPMVSALLGGTVEEKKDVAKSASPVNFVDAKDAPFLIIQGGNDRLVPTEQAEIMRDALTKAGVECEYLLVPEAGHGVPDRQAFQATAAFFDKHLGGHATESIGEMTRRFPALAGGAAAGGEGDNGNAAAGGAGRRRRPNATSQPQ